MKKYTDKEIEKIWEDLEDVLFLEDDDKSLYLADDWFIFPAGTYREAIWEWFNQNYSKGLQALI